MIFVTLGTQKYKFKRIINYIENAKLHDVIIQNGYTKVKNKNLKAVGIISKEEMNKYIEEADFVISHGGITVIELLNMNKKVLCVPRKKGEHINEHQFEMCAYLAQNGYILMAENEEEFKEKIKEIKKFKPKKYKSNDTKFFTTLNKIIKNMLNN